MTQIFRERFINLKTRGTGINYCWNYRPSELLRHFIAYRLDQLNNKHTKIAVNSAIQYFEGHSQKKCLLKVWSFLVHPPQWRPCKISGKLNGNHLLMANIFKLHEYQTFGLMKMHNMCKIWFANKIFSLLRWNKYLSSSFKGFQLLEITLHLQLYWPLKEDFCVISQKKGHFIGHSGTDFQLLLNSKSSKPILNLKKRGHFFKF